MAFGHGERGSCRDRRTSDFRVDTFDLICGDLLHLIRIADEQRKVTQAINPSRDPRSEFKDAFECGRFENRLFTPNGLQASQDVFTGFRFR